MTSKASTPLPIRYRLRRPFGQALDVLGREIASGARLSTSLISGRCVAVVQKESNAYIQREVRNSLQQGGDPETLTALMIQMSFSEASLARAYVMFVSGGGQIFEFSEILGEMFLHSDVDQVPAEEVKLPFERFYLHFRGQLPVGRNKPLGGGSPQQLHMEGAYVEMVSPGVVEIFPMPAAIARDDSPDWLMESGRNGISNRISLNLQAGTLAEAVSRSVDDYMERISRNTDAGTKIFGMSGVGGAAEAGSAISNLTKKQQEDMHETGMIRETIHGVVNIVANALCYVTAYRDRGEEHWAAATPADKLASLERATSPKRKQQLEKDLIWGGYRRVVLFAPESPEDEQEDGNGAPRAAAAAHWRKGHWRMQSYGPREAPQHRLRWIRPSFINPKGATIVQGRIYEA